MHSSSSEELNLETNVMKQHGWNHLKNCTVLNTQTMGVSAALGSSGVILQENMQHTTLWLLILKYFPPFWEF